MDRQPAFFRSGTSRLAFAVFTAALLSVAAVWHGRLESAWSSTRTRSVATSGWTTPPVGAAATRDGYWHTRGSAILNAQEQPVRIAGVNWAGFETERFVAGGLLFQDYRTILRFIKSSGYNVIRIPISNQMVESAAVPSQISFSGRGGSINSDLKGLQSMQILDKIIEGAGELGLKVILDNHRSEAGNSAEANGLWFTDAYPERAWIADWTMLAERYRGNATVIGFDLRNEPHGASKGGACWDCGGARDWHLAAARAGSAVLAVNPRLLIFVEGTDEYGGDTGWWGENLEGARRSPVQLEVADRLVYSPHVYGPNEYSQAWFNSRTSRRTLEAMWQRRWGYLSESGQAPVWIGEFGTVGDAEDLESDESGSQGQWFSTLVGYLEKHPDVGWTYWGVNGEDRYGLMDAEYRGSRSPRRAALLEVIAKPAGVYPEVESERASAASNKLLPEIHKEAASAPANAEQLRQRQGPTARGPVKPKDVPHAVDESVKEATSDALGSMSRMD